MRSPIWRNKRKGLGRRDACSSKVMGFSMDRYEDEIFNMMKSISKKRITAKGKGVQGTTKFDREIKKLQWNVKEKEKSRRGNTSHRSKREHSGW